MRTYKENLVLEQAQRLFETGNLFKAEILCDQVLTAQRNDLRALHLMALIAFKRAQYAKSVEYLEKCRRKRPQDSGIRYDLAQAYSMRGRYAESIDSFDFVLKERPGFDLAISGKADVQERKGDRRAAWTTLTPYYKSRKETEGMAVVIARLLLHENRVDEAIEVSKRHLAKKYGDPVSQRLLALQLGRLYDKRGEYEKAFEAFTLANQSMVCPFSPEEYVNTFDELIGTFSGENLKIVARSSITSELPIFIACMPRSGSTLVEQIIHSHPRAHGAGEIKLLNDLVTNIQESIASVQQYPACIADLRQDSLDSLGNAYLNELKELGHSAIRVTNKNLSNYRHLGMVQMLFPRARVVHIRRNRIDNCLACFMAALMPTEFPWVADQHHMALAWRQYEQLMDHWKEVLDIPILEVRYEELVDNPDQQIRRLIDFCGLEWDDRCLNFHEADRKVMTLSYNQVKQPIFKSAVMRYKNYEPFLGPLIETLGEEPNRS